MKPYVVCRIRVPGFHRWADAPATVDYLSARHRHLFGVTVRLAVDGPDRAIEFFMFQRVLNEWVASRFKRGDDGFEFGGYSCEMIATALATYLQSCDYAVQCVEVDEDGENGGGVWIQ